ncbi:MAG TPA: 1,2-phenylacetyl-CoA epoxidase subunit PaaD [Flavipsychrobacter sp.]|nr:1,2-phenylacetyl-CoA epoxidase subunit PaaD [Flavipsychrobacter sp.]
MITAANIYTHLATVSDPEVPVLSILDLGIVRNVHVNEQEKVTITITPTYSGCPAMDVIAMNIRMVLLSHGIKKIHIENQLSPAWTTDWMSEDGKRKLKEYGIAPPQRKSGEKIGLFEEDIVVCPRCSSDDTTMSSQFGATSCKSLYKCNSCNEPFEHFKCH